MKKRLIVLGATVVSVLGLAAGASASLGSNPTQGPCSGDLTCKLSFD